MKTSIIAAITALSSLVAANPLNKRFNVSVTFYGENGDSYGMLFPTDTSRVEITNPMVVNRITSPGGGFCTFVGVEGETVVIYAEDDKTLETPQAMKWGSCDNN
jgi:hypothetical protein